MLFQKMLCSSAAVQFCVLLFAVCRSLFAVRCALFGVRCSVFGVRCSVFGVRCSPPVIAMGGDLRLSTQCCVDDARDVGDEGAGGGLAFDAAGEYDQHVRSAASGVDEGGVVFDARDVAGFVCDTGASG